MTESKIRGPLPLRNRLIREKRVDEYSSPNLALGMKPVEFNQGISRWVWSEQPSHVLNPFGTLQGGYLAVFVDELFSTAVASVLEDDEWAMTAECKLNFLRALNPGRLEGSAKVLRRGRALAFLEAQVTRDDAIIAVTASSTWAVSRQ